MSEQDLVDACDGLTGHKYVQFTGVQCSAVQCCAVLYQYPRSLLMWLRAARHGLTLKGKLHRVQEADRQFAMGFGQTS
jgi:hypothetical protein